MHSMHAQASEVRRAVPLQAVPEQWCAGQIWIHTRIRRHCTSLPYRHWCGLTAQGSCARPSHTDIARMLNRNSLRSAPLGLGALPDARPALTRGEGKLGVLLQVSLGPHSRPATTWRGCMTLPSGETTLRRPTMASMTTSTLTSTGKILLHHLPVPSCSVQMLQTRLVLFLAHLTV